jgi:hypothetical protein
VVPQARSFRLRRAAGIVLLYRIGAAVGVPVRGTARLPHVSAP